MTQTSEGTVTFRGFSTWYRIDGDLEPGGPTPLLVLHGGPGLPHDYLLDLAELDRPVVFYDQLGCGNSDHPKDPSLWTMATFLDELATVRSALRLERVHLLGHSWGGWLALEHALGGAEGLASLVLASTSASVPATVAESLRLKESLPGDVQAVIDRHEADGTTDDPAYLTATREYKARWTIRTSPLPEHVMRAVTRLGQEVYETMYGTEWNPSGNMKDWDVTARLGELRLPTLVTSGRYDELTPAVVQPLVDGIAGAVWTVFEESAHTTTAEEPERYREVLAAFLAEVDEKHARGM